MADRRRITAAGLALLAASALTGGLAGCSGASSASEGASRASLGVARKAAALPLSPSHAARGPVEGLQAVSADAIAPAKLPAEVIETAVIRLQVGHGRVAPTVGRIRRLALGEGGYVSHSSVTSSGQRSGSIVVRIPQRRFTAALAAIGVMGRVTAENDAGRDVTSQFIDLSARLVNLRSQENFLRRLMARAGTVRGSIEIEGQLAQVQLGIEQITGQLRYLSNRTAFSTITVGVGEAGARAPVHHHASTLWKAAARSLHGGLAVVTAVIIGAGYTIPVALLALIALGAARLLRPRLVRAATGTEGGGAES
jgi:hypothetical protein